MMDTVRVLYSLYMFQSCHYEKSKATIIQVEWALLKYHKLKENEHKNTKEQKIKMFVNLNA